MKSKKIVKKYRVDSDRFHEISKNSYKQIINKIENIFVDKSARWNENIHWTNMGNYKLRLKYFSMKMKNWK